MTGIFVAYVLGTGVFFWMRPQQGKPQANRLPFCLCVGWILIPAKLIARWAFDSRRKIAK